MSRSDNHTVRTYGNSPYSVAVIHGGPGAPGSMAPVGRELAAVCGVIEPFQTKDSLEDQIEELESQIREYCTRSTTLVASSWGAVLALLLAERSKNLVQKLVLIGSAVFDPESSNKTKRTRLERLTDNNRKRYDILMLELERSSAHQQKGLVKEWIELLFDADVYDPLTRDLEIQDYQYHINKQVWADFVDMRDQGNLLRERLSKIETPTVVIHGDFDPHPIEGIQPLLESTLQNVSFHILSQCGHYPWIERHARNAFFDLMNKQILNEYQTSQGEPC